MSMVTSCPACTTTFRVTQEQLKRRAGQVRCGNCRAVFDAFKSLATMPDEGQPDGGAIASPGDAFAAGPAALQSSAQSVLDIGPAHAHSPSGSAGGARAAQRARMFWRFAVAVLAAALLLQVGFAFRDRLSAAMPGLRPLFEAMCTASGCTVSPPRRSEQLAIESSDLQANPTRPNVIVLTAALRNRGTTVVAHPAIELTLTSAQDQPLARRIFLPADYLREPQDAQRGMSALAEVNVRIELDTGDLRPAGYRLFLFYP